ncbi:zinc-binding dehydrogenase [Streptomyces sp. BA2]|uniref:zinc-binding dehydrogenase n=1 Tax=Streptomyces sp. BA2 TaxID=436595 RepID=UPI0013242F4C|nr:zinc-binding dehydrogenase [Streptomyces sp. BA2]MWA08239.1 zinc-binding dehydrogenase [Streptomyces sp. BA2]
MPRATSRSSGCRTGLPGVVPGRPGRHRSGQPISNSVVDKTFDLTDITTAHRYMEANGQIGKIVVNG